MTSALHIHTPLLKSHPLSELIERNVYVKMDAMQPSGSFKDRGIGKLCMHYAQQGKKGLVSSSAGNAGIAVAYAGRQLGLDVKVIVPTSALLLSVSKMLAEDADVITQGHVWNDADIYARELAKELDYAYIPPFDHPIIWQGYESIIDELKKDKIKPDAIITSVGGGGLFTGLIQGLIKHKWSKVALITAETEGAASLAKSFQTKQRITLDSIDTIATTLGAKQICEQAFNYLSTHPVYPQVLSDKATIQAVAAFADHHRVLVEPACGAALAVAYQNLPVLKQFKNIAIIICGGNGVSVELLNGWKQQFQVD
ncbi:MAG: pyridoxal-phosphate dependent enzyme [Candidatus Berkiella sp.]